LIPSRVAAAAWEFSKNIVDCNRQPDPGFLLRGVEAEVRKHVSRASLDPDPTLYFRHIAPRNPPPPPRIEYSARLYQNRDTLKGEMVIRLNIQPQAAREFRHGLDLRPARLGDCNVLLGRFRSTTLFWRVMNLVIAGTNRRGTTMTV
jgi:hypothetical protein